MPTILRYARWSLLLAVLVLLLVVRCLAPDERDERHFTMDPALADRSLLTNEPCAPPCWYGLVPDVSTKDEVINKLQTLPFIAARTIHFTLEGNRFQTFDLILRFGCQTG